MVTRAVLRKGGATPASAAVLSVTQELLETLEEASFPALLVRPDRQIAWFNDAVAHSGLQVSLGLRGGALCSSDAAIEGRLSAALNDLMSLHGPANFVLQIRGFRLLGMLTSAIDTPSLNGLCRYGSLILLIAVGARAERAEIASLTRVERSIVDGLCAGKNVRELSAEMKISYHTARKYLQRIYEKTGSRRQAELVAKLAGSA